MMKKFIMCGTLGWCLEILFTSIESFRKREMKLKGNTSIWMFPIYGTGILILPLYYLMKRQSPVFRGFVYSIAIFTVEFLSGTFLKKRAMCPWDYSKSKWNIDGVIRLDYAPVWFLTGLIFEKFLIKKRSEEK
ncbi:MAG: hypothetical protein Q4G60_04015 [bacterium]|nr:hypothetical protein [bacterium]